MMSDNGTWPNRVAVPQSPLYDLIEDPNLPGRPAGWYVQWHITSRCNLRCRHCYDTGDRYPEMGLADKLTALDRLVDFSRRHRRFTQIALTGGEALASPDLWPLLDRTLELFQRGYPLDLHLMTNGFSVDEAALDRLRRYRPLLRSFQVSLDGASAAVNDAIRGRGVHDRAVHCLRLLAREGYQTALHFVVHDQNVAEAPAVVDLAEELEVQRVTISRLVPIGRGEADLMLSPTRLQQLLVRLHARGEQLSRAASGRKRATFIARGRCDLWHLADPARAESLLRQRATALERLGSRCPVGSVGLTLMADGTVLPCRRLEISLGNILERPLFDMWYRTDLLWRLRRRETYQQGKCRRCRYLMDPSLRSLCAGGAPCISHAVTGSCFRPDPQCWHEPGLSPDDTTTGLEV